MDNTHIKAVILAAGKGTRLQTDGNDAPKVMRTAAGRPLLAHVLSALDFIPAKDCVIVAGYKKESVIEAFPGYVFAEQKEQLGTGHAVMAAFSKLEGYSGQLLVCYGDMPLLKRETYRALIGEHISSGSACTILSGVSDMDLPYGRIIRDKDGIFSGVVEDRDATPEQKKIRELNIGVYMFDACALREVLSELKSDNAQGEYYLTDAPLILKNKGCKIGVCRRELGYEVLGVNTPAQLKLAEEILSK